ncbi:MAG: hypothetical protein M1819_007308 [Sarea resinae]|nr:MAG: hypothetical protein M1819_007308 [Sarea resinae]
MQGELQWERLDSPSRPSSRRRRTTSISSDKASLTGSISILLPPTTVNPPAAYIGASAASQLLASSLLKTQNLVEDADIEISEDSIAVSPSSLALVNAFLDQLLFNFLSAARSTSLASLRSAIYEVLKPKLGREAIAGADEELQTILDGGDDEELSAFHNGQESRGDWELELVWKRTRLRCMVYTRLGDMEDDDEELYTEQENLDDDGVTYRRYSSQSGVVSPPVAIFLTSIIEYIGEQTLAVAGRAAYDRLLKSKKMSANRPHEGSSPADDDDDEVTVEDYDTEKIALNSTLGRLWRTWRKRARSPSRSVSGLFPRDISSRGGYYSTLPKSVSRKSSLSTVDGRNDSIEGKPNILLNEVSRQDSPALIPLPIAEHDVEEIEIPGFADRGAKEAPALPTKSSRRHKSLDMVFHRSTETPAPIMASGSARHTLPLSKSSSMPLFEYIRPSSPQSQQAMSSKAQSVSDADDGLFATPLERPDTVLGLPSTETDGMTAKGNSSDEPEADPSVSQETGKARDRRASVADVIAGAAAVGSTILEGVTAAARGQAPNGGPEESDAFSENDFTSDGPDFDDDEVPQIMGSTRVSFEEARTPVEIVQARARSYTWTDPSPVEPIQEEPALHEGEESASIKDQDDIVNLLEPNNSTDERVTQDMAGGVQSYQASVAPTQLPSPSNVDKTRSVQIEQPKKVEHDQERESEFHNGDDTEVGFSAPSKEASPKEEAPSDFVLSDAPAPRSQRNSSNSLDAKSDDQKRGSLASSVADSRRSGVASGVPPLTPLREFLEGVGESSDEASLSASYDSGTIDLDPSSENLGDRNSAGGDSSNPQNAEKSTEIETPSRSRQASTSTPASSVTERAAVQRITPSTLPPRSPTVPKSPVAPVPTSPVLPKSPMLPLSPIFPRSSRAESVGEKDKRSNHSLTDSSGSNVSSKIKNVIGWRQDGSDKPISITRSSNDDKRSMRSEMLPQTDTQDVKQNSFDELIQSEETIQYTLTPQSVREAEAKKGVANTENIAPNSSDLTPRPGTSRSTASSLKAPNFFNAVSRPESSQSTPARPTGKVSLTMSRPGTAEQRTRKGAYMAREPRVQGESLRDFADFIRSTGPSNEKKAMPPRLNPVRPLATIPDSNRPATAINTLQPPDSPTSILTPVRSNNTVPTSTLPPIAGARASSAASSRTKTRLKAREATVPRKNSSSDLIDFIRQGPPSDGGGQNNEVPRTAAPSKMTTDSNDLSARGPGKREALSTDTRDSSLLSKSIESQNSRTKLLGNHDKTFGGDEHVSLSQFDGPPAPKRKQRRVRDPYAIDSDDDDEDILQDMKPKPKPKRQEESLIDFLNNVPPPPQPPSSSGFREPQQARKTLQKKHSTTSIASRFGRKQSISSSRKNSVSATPTQPLHPLSANPPQLRPVSRNQSPLFDDGSQLGKPGASVESQKGPSPSDNGPSTQFSNGAGNRIAARSGPAFKSRANGDNGRTNDLADFFKNTEPPPSASSMHSPSVKEQSGFSKIFRRMKSMAAT